jgi:hypothetical protein
MIDDTLDWIQDNILLSGILGTGLVLTHTGLAFFILLYDRLLQRPFSLGIFARLGLWYCAVWILIGFIDIRCARK